MAISQQPNPLNAGHARQTNINEYSVREIRINPRQGLFHGTVTTQTTIPLGAVDQDAQAFPDLSLIFNDGYFDGPREL
jgi:hypothetical protein